MGRVIRSCIQSVLKLLNCITGMVGLAMILYAVWVIRAWQTQFDDSPFDESNYFAPWFIYTILSLGVFRASSCAQVIQLQKQQTDAAFIWINLNAVLICSFLGLSLLVAMVLKALGSRQYCDSDDDDDASHRVPLLKQPQYVFGNPVM